MENKITKSSVPAILLASLTAIGASVCCVVPFVLVVLGISGAWIGNLAALDAWRPWFSTATLICLGLAFWNVYGPSSRCCNGGECINPKVLRRRRWWLWLATVVIALLLLLPYYISWFI